MKTSLLLFPLALACLSASAQAQHPRLLPTEAAAAAQAPSISSEPAPAPVHAALATASPASVAASASQVPAGHVQPGHAPAAPVVATRPAQGRIGDATRSLFQLQASGQASAAVLPMLGEPSNAAYQRHMDSFKHPIPEFFDTTVDSGSDTPR